MTVMTRKVAANKSGGSNDSALGPRILNNFSLIKRRAGCCENIVKNEYHVDAGARTLSLGDQLFNACGNNNAKIVPNNTSKNVVKPVFVAGDYNNRLRKLKSICVKEADKIVYDVGSYYFNDILGSNIQIVTDTDINLENSDFTIEWFQYQTDGHSHPRLFQIGSYDTGTPIGVSIEGGTFYLWLNSTPYAIINFEADNEYKNKWVHFVVQRESNSITVYMDNAQIGSTINFTDAIDNSIDPLTIGHESNLTDENSAFGGYITNFRWIKGTALYMTPPLVPPQPLSDITNTKLLLLASKGNPYINSSIVTKSVSFNDILWNSMNPF